MATPATGVSSTISAGLQVNGNFGLVGTATIGLDSVVGRNLTVAGAGSIQGQRILTAVDLTTLNSTIASMQTTITNLSAQVAQLSGGSSSSNLGSPVVLATSFNFSSVSPMTFASGLPANAIVNSVQLIVDTPFNGTAPTVSIGVASNPSKYMATTDNNLTIGGVYQTTPGLISDTSNESIIVTCSEGNSTAGSARIILMYSIPIAV